VSAERAGQDMKEQARREADLIVSEAGAEGRKLIRDAISEKEHLLAETRRMRSILQAALEVISEGEESKATVEEETSTDASRESDHPRLAGPATGAAGVGRLAG